MITFQHHDLDDGKLDNPVGYGLSAGRDELIVTVLHLTHALGMLRGRITEVQPVLTRIGEGQLSAQRILHENQIGGQLKVQLEDQLELDLTRLGLDSTGPVLHEDVPLVTITTFTTFTTFATFTTFTTFATFTQSLCFFFFSLAVSSSSC